MEGTCGKILPTDSPSRVKKIVYWRASKQRRTKSLRAFDQWRIQTWLHKLCQATQGFTVLRVPNAYDPEPRAYTMDRIDASAAPLRIEEVQADGTLMADLRRLLGRCKAHGLYPMDFELYRQVDGTVAMVDFDKFGRWRPDGSVEFAFGMIWSPSQTRTNTWIQ